MQRKLPVDELGALGRQREVSEFLEHEQAQEPGHQGTRLPKKLTH